MTIKRPRKLRSLASLMAVAGALAVGAPLAPTLAGAQGFAPMNSPSGRVEAEPAAQIAPPFSSTVTPVSVPSPAPQPAFEAAPIETRSAQVMTAQATTAQASGPANACVKPAAPRYPRAGQHLTLEQLDWTRDQRDRFLAASTTYLSCLDRDIESRMRLMVETNVDDPGISAVGTEHQSSSAAVGEAIKAFALLCYDYEGRAGVAYAPGCVPGAPR